MGEKKVDVKKMGLFSSILLTVLSIICLIYNIVNGEKFIIWIAMLAAGICLLCGNLLNNSNKK